ncbi:MAG: DUF4214 domain-containing protein [Methyloprofundus sp.]|nr:DUF4214 domain-containing protein [Methyloprofundus sp.]
MTKTGNQVSIELSPDTSAVTNRIELQFKDSHSNIVQVDHSDIFWAETKTNHAPQLATNQLTQMVGAITGTQTLVINTFDADGDNVSLSVVDAEGGTASFNGNQLNVSFADNKTLHTVKIALNDGKESVTKDIAVLRFDSDSIKRFYSDVSSSHTYAKDIAFATLKGIIWGQPDLSNQQQRIFRPNDNASWAEALKMVLKAAAATGKIDLPDSEYYLKAFPAWAMPYYTFAREQGAINFQQADLSLIYPSREEIAMLIVRALSLDLKLADYPELSLDFTDKEQFSTGLMDRYGQIARLFGLFMNADTANPQAKVTRAELAQVISKLFMMPSAEINALDSIEYGDSFTIQALANQQALMINEDYQLVDSSADLSAQYAINLQQLSGLTVDSSLLNIGDNDLIALVDNHGVRDFIYKQISVNFSDNDFDGVQNEKDIWADDYRYQLDQNGNFIPDILDAFYNLSHKTLSDTVTQGQLTVSISQFINNGGFICVNELIVAHNPETSEVQSFNSLCDVPVYWQLGEAPLAISPSSATFYSRVAVAIQGAGNESIYYTTDGSAPTLDSNLYSEPFKLNQTAVVNAIAVSDTGEITRQANMNYTVLAEHVWTPVQGLNWQWQLQGEFDASVEAQIYDLDLFDTPTETIAELHAAGQRVICYFNAGAFEDWRTDAGDFPEPLKGNTLAGFADEKWLDIRDIEGLAPVMQTRFDLAVTKGCDAVEPDNVDAYLQDTGFALSADDQIRYNLWLSNQANARGLSIGLKNDLEQISQLEPFFDWALNEQCFEYDECDLLQPFVSAKKAIFGAEYITDSHQPDQAAACAVSAARKFSWIFKDPDLESPLERCANIITSWPEAWYSHAWILEHGTGIESGLALRSDSIADNETAVIIWHTALQEAGFVNFNMKVASELDADFFRFYIDDALQAEYSGLIDWANYQYPLAAGEHTLRFEYTKNTSLSIGSDAAWIDNIEFSIDRTKQLQSAFIERLYENILGRPSDSGGLSSWLNYIQSSSATSMAFGFFKSAEFQNLNLSNTAFVHTLYNTVLGRDADPSGLSHWVGLLNQGVLRESILYGFFRSAEFDTLAQGSGMEAFSNDDNKTYQVKSFVQRLYLNVLGRNPDQQGLDDTSNPLISGEFSTSEIVLGFFLSGEFIEQGHDNSSFINIAYLTLLNRASDAGGVITWSEQLNNGLSRGQIVKDFIASPEFATLAASYGINAE